MKLQVFLKAFLVSQIILSVSPGTMGQNPGTGNAFSMRVSPGILSFHGDLSNSGYDPFSLIRDNSKPGFALTAIKEIDKWFAVQATYIAGNLYSINRDENQYFSGSLSEFSVSGHFSPLGLIRNYKDNPRLSPYFSFGLGSFGFRSCRKHIDTGDIDLPCYGFETDGMTKLPRKNALTIPIGIGITIPVNKNLAIDLDHTHRITNTDVLDAFVGNSTNNDRYSLTSIGIRFTIYNRQHPIAEQSIADSEVLVTDHHEHISENIYIECITDDLVTSGEVFSMNIRINKGSYTGKARLVQLFPKGFNILEAKSIEGRFSALNQNVLVEWDEMPADSIVSFTYFVRAEKQTAGSQTISGSFEYSAGSKPATIRFNNYIFVDNRVDVIDDKALIVEDEKQIITEDNKEVKTDIDTITETGTGLTKFETLPGVEFRIQCGAFKDSNQGGLKLAERFGITEDMREVYEKGWYKYTIGSFTSYPEAIKYREDFIRRTKLDSAFIVAYKDGKRLNSVNDAFRR